VLSRKAGWKGGGIVGNDQVTRMQHIGEFLAHPMSEISLAINN
jgi:hypothetical protein